MHARRRFLAMALVAPAALLAACAPAGGEVPPAATQPVSLRLGVQMTPQELQTFRPAVERLAAARGWTIAIEETPQAAFTERLNAQVVAGTLPDVQHVQGLFAQQFIRQNAFLDLSARLDQAAREAFYPGPLAQFVYGERYWGVPFSAAPDVVFFNTAMFDAAGLAYPDASWTFDRMREAARTLTRDAAGRMPGDAGFDPQTIVQWGWGISPSSIWSRFLLQPLGGETCADADCTTLRLTDPATIAALEWWAEMAQQDFSVPYDPYGGSQTGVPGEPFVAGKAAMSSNGFFAVGQLNAQGGIPYDIAQPLLGRDGRRTTALSVQGFVIAATSASPDAAWELVRELTDGAFMAEAWAKPGHGVPARRDAATTILDPGRPPKSQQAILDALEYAEILRPDTASAFEAFSKTSGLFTQMMKGELSVPDGAARVEQLANQALARDRA
jgi:multiple sugar transport system substrate-binding protein